MYIAGNELSDWLNESKAIKNAVLNCYKETISDMSDNLLTDPRSCNNHHIVNPDFLQTPKYMMGFYPDLQNNQPQIGLSHYHRIPLNISNIKSWLIFF